MDLDAIDLVALLTAVAGGIGYLIARLDARSVRARLKADVELLKSVPADSTAYNDLLVLVNAEARALRPDRRTWVVRLEAGLLRAGIAGTVVAVVLFLGVRILIMVADRVDAAVLEVVSAAFLPAALVAILAMTMLAPWFALMLARRLFPDVHAGWRVGVAALVALGALVGVITGWVWSK